MSLIDMLRPQAPPEPKGVTLVHRLAPEDQQYISVKRPKLSWEERARRESKRKYIDNKRRRESFKLERKI